MDFIERNLYTEEQLMFGESVLEFAKKEIAPYHAQWEKDKMIDRELWRKAGELGILAPQVPEEYGGMGIDDFRFNCIIDEVLSKTGFTGPSLGFSVHTDIVVPYIIHYGSEEVKQKWLPQVVTGDAVCAIGMTEPGAGSDLKALRTTAEDKGDHYLLNGSKTFITNGYLADIVVVAAKTDPEKGAKGISLLLVDAHSEGFRKGKPFEKVGMHAQDTCELFFDDVKVPKGNLLGAEGQGFVYMMTELPQERLVVGIGGLAAAQGALEETIRYVKERKAFGKTVSQFQNTRYVLAELATEVAMGWAFLDRCIELHNQKKLDSATASMIKFRLTDLQGQVIDKCVQLHGGYGYMWEYYVARAWADARAQRIYAGSNEIMKELISRKILK